MLVVQRRVTVGAAMVVALACGDDPTAPVEDTLLPINGFTTTLVDTTGNVGYGLSLARDPSGALHASYMGDPNGALKYAMCAANCATQSNWAITVVDTGLFGYNQFTWIGIDGGGRVHIGYSTADSDSGFVRYATCSALCATPANWTATLVTTSANVAPAFTVAGNARVHALWFAKQRDSVVYGTCAGSCSVPGAWSRATIAAAPNPASVAITLDGSGALHTTMSTVDSTFGYAVCGSSCLSRTQWRRVDLPWQGSAMVVAAGVALDAAGRAHISYTDWGRRSWYMYCASSCAKTGNWQVTLSDTTVGRVGYALVTTPGGRPRLPYYDIYHVEGVLVGVCDSIPCDVVAKWRTLPVEAGNAGQFTSLVLDSWGRPIVAYHNNDAQDLRVAFPY